MNDLGYLICEPCRTYITLGKPVLRDDGGVNYYHTPSSGTDEPITVIAYPAMP